MDNICNWLILYTLSWHLQSAGTDLNYDNICKEHLGFCNNQGKIKKQGKLCGLTIWHPIQYATQTGL